MWKYRLVQSQHLYDPYSRLLFMMDTNCFGGYAPGLMEEGGAEKVRYRAGGGIPIHSPCGVARGVYNGNQAERSCQQDTYRQRSIGK